jgi:large subunit ribosomal protein L13
VVVINAAQVKVTGRKETDKMYYRQPRAGFPGALKRTNLQKLRERHPEDIIINAVRRMLPRNALGRQMMTKLKVYAGDTHPHQAQQPQPRQVEA